MKRCPKCGEVGRIEFSTAPDTMIRAACDACGWHGKGTEVGEVREPQVMPGFYVVCRTCCGGREYKTVGILRCPEKCEACGGHITRAACYPMRPSQFEDIQRARKSEAAFQAILAEEWMADAEHLLLVSHEQEHARAPTEAEIGVVIGTLASFGTPALWKGCQDDVMRAELAVLGKEAVALLLERDKHGVLTDAELALFVKLKKLREGQS